MLLPITEALPAGGAIDQMPLDEAAEMALSSHERAAAAVREALPAIVDAAGVMARAVREGGVLHYAAAGSSGLMALADCSELGGTFGIAASQIRIHMAGGVPVDGHMPGDTEDDMGAAVAAAGAAGVGDVFIILSASGTTPYALAIQTAARERGAHVIGIANNAGTPLLERADTAICLATEPEVIAGSTRLGAGTAQKVALNLMSSLMGVRLGHVYQGRMVNLVADNAKLVARATGIVAEIAGVDEASARAALKKANGRVKPAILISVGASPEEALARLDAHEGLLGPCLHHMTT